MFLLEGPGERGVKISQETFADQFEDEYGIESVGVFRFRLAAEFDRNEAPGNWPFCELVGSPMRLSTQTRPEISNAVGAVARYCASPKLVHWRAALGIFGYFGVCETDCCSSFGISFRRGRSGRVLRYR